MARSVPTHNVGFELSLDNLSSVQFEKVKFKSMFQFDKFFLN